MTPTTPEGWHSVTPRLFVDDPAAEVDFLREAFRAVGEFQGERPSELRVGDSVVMVSGVGPRPRTASVFYLYVDNLDETYHRALEAGATSMESPLDTPWGDRRAIIEDPSGTVWQLATHGGAAR
jgi:uncharacterized glyoxalase superfamily protein PhnB